MWKQNEFLKPPHPLTNFEIQKHYQNELRFNGVFSRTHWIALFCYRSEIVYFDSFGVEHVPEATKKFVRIKNIKVNIFQVQANNSMMCGYFCIGFIDFLLAGKKLTDFTNLFSSHDFEKNDSIVLSFFKDE